MQRSGLSRKGGAALGATEPTDAGLASLFLVMDTPNGGAEPRHKWRGSLFQSALEGRSLVEDGRLAGHRARGSARPHLAGADLLVKSWR